MIPSVVKRILRRTGLLAPAYAFRERLRRFGSEERAHRRAMHTFYGSLVSSGDLCFDVGANVGNRVAVLLDLGAKVIAVEPQPDCVRVLERDFGDRITIVRKALSDGEGEAELAIGEVSTVSTMSREWQQKVTETNRFSDLQWTRTIKVPTTTLDRLIEEHGLPRFCKIDVEGFEYMVLRGLTRPIEAVSFEFTAPEYLSNAHDCIRYLAGLGDYTFNYSLGESMTLALNEWVQPERMITITQALPSESLFGDIYARLRRP